MWVEIIMLDGNRGLINLDRVVDIWMDNGADFATILQATEDEVEIPAAEYDRIKRLLESAGKLRR